MYIMYEVLSNNYMNHYLLTLDENGGEYEGDLDILTPYELIQTDSQTVKTGKVVIKWNEQILKVEKV